MGRLKNQRSQALDAPDDKPPQWFDLSCVIFEREPHPRPQMLNLTRLSRNDAAISRCVWECIKRTRPALAELLQDTNLHELQEYFNGEISIELE